MPHRPKPSAILISHPTLFQVHVEPLRLVAASPRAAPTLPRTSDPTVLFSGFSPPEPHTQTRIQFRPAERMSMPVLLGATADRMV
jgi:hypothetical protein